MRLTNLQDALAASQQRLHPSITNPSWLVLTKRREIFQKWIEQLPTQNITVLDVGGRLQPYRSLLKSRAHQYISVDIHSTPLLDVVANGQQLPFPSATFDLVICTQMLEYVFEPHSVLSEIHRVLRPNAVVMLSVPSAHVRDNDHECWSFHPESMRRLLMSFTDVKIIPEGGSILGFFCTMNVCLSVFAKYSLIRLALSLTLFPFFNALGYLLETLSWSSNQQFTVNYSALARK